MLIAHYFLAYVCAEELAKRSGSSLWQIATHPTMICVYDGCQDPSGEQVATASISSLYLSCPETHTNDPMIPQHVGYPGSPLKLDTNADSASVPLPCAVGVSTLARGFLSDVAGFTDVYGNHLMISSRTSGHPIPPSPGLIHTSSSETLMAKPGLATLNTLLDVRDDEGAFDDSSVHDTLSEHFLVRTWVDTIVNTLGAVVITDYHTFTETVYSCEAHGCTASMHVSPATTTTEPSMPKTSTVSSEYTLPLSLADSLSTTKTSVPNTFTTTETHTTLITTCTSPGFDCKVRKTITKTYTLLITTCTLSGTTEVLTITQLTMESGSSDFSSALSEFSVPESSVAKSTETTITFSSRNPSSSLPPETSSASKSLSSATSSLALSETSPASSEPRTPSSSRISFSKTMSTSSSGGVTSTSCSECTPLFSKPKTSTSSVESSATSSPSTTSSEFPETLSTSELTSSQTTSSIEAVSLVSSKSTVVITTTTSFQTITVTTCTGSSETFLLTITTSLTRTLTLTTCLSFDTPDALTSTLSTSLQSSTHETDHTHSSTGSSGILSSLTTSFWSSATSLFVEPSSLEPFSTESKSTESADSTSSLFVTSATLEPESISTLSTFRISTTSIRLSSFGSTSESTETPPPDYSTALSLSLPASVPSSTQQSSSVFTSVPEYETTADSLSETTDTTTCTTTFSEVSEFSSLLPRTSHSITRLTITSSMPDENGSTNSRSTTLSGGASHSMSYSHSSFTISTYEGTAYRSFVSKAALALILFLSGMDVN